MDGISRAVLWFSNDLPPAEMLTAYSLHISGPSVKEAGRPTQFHTFACLFPGQRMYLAAKIGDEPGCSIDPLELREIIATAEVPPEKMADQRAVIAEYGVARMSPQDLWDVALIKTLAVRLPIALYAIGNTIDTGERVVFLHAMVLAPLDMVVAKFKEAAPRINLN